MNTKQKISLFENESAVNLYGYELILKNILAVLLNLGLTRAQADILVYLKKTGDCTAFNVAKALGLPKLEVYHNLISMQKMNFVSSVNLSNPSKFRAVVMNEILLWPNYEKLLKNDLCLSDHLKEFLR